MDVTKSASFKQSKSKLTRGIKSSEVVEYENTPNSNTKDKNKVGTAGFIGHLQLPKGEGSEGTTP